MDFSAKFQKPMMQSLFRDFPDGRQIDAELEARIVRILSGGIGNDIAVERVAIEALPRAEQVAMARRQLDAKGRADLTTILNDPDLKTRLAPETAKLLSAVLGASELEISQAALQAVAGGPGNPQAEAVKKMKQLITTGKLRDYYDAAIGAVNNPTLAAEAKALFAALPAITPTSHAADMVKMGYWTVAPRGIEQVLELPRYVPGRQVIVETTVDSTWHGNSNDFSTWAAADAKFLTYMEGGSRWRTYKAVLTGENGDNFLVKVEGREQPIEIPKREVYKWNQPYEYGGGYGGGTSYEDPFMKAKLAEAAICMDPLVQQLDFTNTGPKKNDGLLVAFGSNAKLRSSEQILEACATIVHDSIDMVYSSNGQPARSGGGGSGRMAIRGVGACNSHARVMFDLLLPFQNSLGLDLQFHGGPTYTNARDNDNIARGGGGHCWISWTMRANLKHMVTDLTWNQPAYSLGLAYSRFGGRAPQPSGTMRPVEAKDVDMSGTPRAIGYDASVADKESGGRSNHKSKLL